MVWYVTTANMHVKDRNIKLGAARHTTGAMMHTGAAASTNAARFYQLALQDQQGDPGQQQPQGSLLEPSCASGMCSPGCGNLLHS